MIIHNYEEFTEELLAVGMTLGGENGEGVFTLCDRFDESLQWHTEDPETDPWEWRMRVLRERDDIAYGKFFFKKSGYITKEWYPYFYAVRRGNRTLEEEYDAGELSRTAMTIYTLLEEHKELPLHLIKQYGGFTRENKSAFDRGITELQMKFYLTMCGKAPKISNKGAAYGWSSTVFCLTEDFFGPEAIATAESLNLKAAYEKIETHIHNLNPQANPTKVKKFITGL